MTLKSDLLARAELAEKEDNKRRVALRNAIRIIKIEENETKLTIDDIKLDTFASEFEQQLCAINEFGAETVPRETLLKMLAEGKLDEPFTFKTIPNSAEAYLQSMRMVLSRVRNRARKQKKPLSEFKLLLVKIDKGENYDEITLMRSRVLSPKDESVYDALSDMMAKQVKKEEQ